MSRDPSKEAEDDLPDEIIGKIAAFKALEKLSRSLGMDAQLAKRPKRLMRSGYHAMNELMERLVSELSDYQMRRGLQKLESDDGSTDFIFRDLLYHDVDNAISLYIGGNREKAAVQAYESVPWDLKIKYNSYLHKHDPAPKIPIISNLPRLIPPLGMPPGGPALIGGHHLQSSSYRPRPPHRLWPVHQFKRSF